MQVTPGEWQLHLERTNPAYLTEANLRQWLADLIALVRAAEALPPPEAVVEMPRTNEPHALNTWVASAPVKAMSVPLGAISSLIPILFGCGAFYFTACMFIQIWIRSIMAQLGLLG